jgi:hypothetical protein
MEKLYHGTDDKIPYVERFVSGSDQFAGLFTRESNGSLLNLYLKRVLSRQRTDFTVGKGKNDEITPSKLQAKSGSCSEPMNGAALARLVEKVLENAKKALAFAKAYLVGEQLPSGKTFEDFAEYLLEKMFRDIKKNKGKTRSPEWFFRGFFAFLAWGPVTLDGRIVIKNRLFLLVEEEKAADKKGRKELRAEVLESHAVAKKAKVESARAAKEDATIANSLPSQEERLVQMMSLHLDSNQRSDALKEEYLKSRKEDALQVYKMELDLLKINPDGDKSDLLKAKAEYKKTVKEWEDYASGLFANKKRVEVDVEFINSYMAKEKSKAIDLTADDDDEVRGKSCSTAQQVLPVTLNAKDPPAAENISGDSDADDSNDFLFTTPALLTKTKGPVVNAASSASYQSEITEVAETSGRGFAPIGRTFPTLDRWNSSAVNNPLFNLPPLNLLPNQVNIDASGSGAAVESQLTFNSVSKESQNTCYFD